MSQEQDWGFPPLHPDHAGDFAQPAFDAYRGKEIQRGRQSAANDELDAFIREHAESAYHLAAPADRRAHDPMAVVDPQCRVIGVDALRVVDSSFSASPNGNLNAPSIMVGEESCRHTFSAARRWLARTPSPGSTRTGACRTLKFLLGRPAPLGFGPLAGPGTPSKRVGSGREHWLTVYPPGAHG